jgi:hypothetical protein
MTTLHALTVINTLTDRVTVPWFVTVLNYMYYNLASTCTFLVGLHHVILKYILTVDVSK